MSNILLLRHEVCGDLCRRPEFFDAVVADEQGRVLRIEVKNSFPSSSWVWGAFKMPGAILHELYETSWEQVQC